MSHCGMRMRIMTPILVLLLVLLLFPIVVVDGRRHTDDRTSSSSSSSSSSFVRLTPRKLPMTVRDADHRVPTTTIPSTTNDESSRDDMVNSDVTVFDKSNHHNSTIMESSTSKTITRVTPTSLIVNDDDDDDDHDDTVVSPILNVPRHSTDIYTIDHPNREIDDDDDIKPLDEESVIRLRYHRTNSIDHRNHNDDDGDDEHKHGFFHRSRTSTTSTKDIAMSFPPLQTPIVYRYYPRQPHASSARTRSTGGTTIPFVLLGPHVDHWKSVAQALSLCGFHVIAVGPKDPVRHIHNNDDDVPTTTSDTNTGTKPPPPVPYELGLSSVLTSSNDSHNNNNNNDRYLEGPGLVLQLLDALRWKKIILVGCDCEAAWAVQAALLLPPDRIAGLIICGNLHECERIFVESYSTSSSTSTRSSSSPFELDRFLQERLSCPFTIVWDGTNDKTAVSSSSSSSTTTLPLDSVPIGMSSKSSTSAGSSNSHCSHRSVIIGGGTSPHRRRPGIFAWILTRFVEERIAPAVSIPSSSTTSATARSATSRFPGYSTDTTTPRLSVIPLWLSSLPLWKLPSRIPVLWNVDDMFNEESMVVFGRIVATAIFYAISLKVLVYQYGNIRDVIDVVTSIPRHIISMVHNRMSNISSSLLFIGRIPFMIIPFGRRVSYNHNNNNNETGIEIKATISSKNDQPEDQSDGSEDNKDDQEKSESTTESDLRPFFFLDHVVA